jgi:hypothetical protein
MATPCGWGQARAGRLIVQVFICWSGDRAKALAVGLKSWLENVLQATEPWLSEEIDKGTRWGPEITDHLRRSRVGIVCLTPENLGMPWVHFEAGAISNTPEAHVCTLLLDLEKGNIAQPLGQFEHTTTTKADVEKLVHTINRQVGKSGEKELSETRVSEVFEAFWPHLEKLFQEVRSLPAASAPAPRMEWEILQEILELVRGLDRRMGQGPLVSSADLWARVAEIAQGARRDAPPFGMLIPSMSTGSSPRELVWSAADLKRTFRPGDVLITERKKAGSAGDAPNAESGDDPEATK